MIGIVVVSHSLALAEAAVALADEMVHGEGPVVAVAAGAAGGFGTDATEVRRAMEKAASPDGVLVLMDLGSAVLSAELALELGPPSEHAVRLTAAPMVEGLVAAVVRAAGGADLETVAREAEAALLPKVVSLAEHTPAACSRRGRGGRLRPAHAGQPAGTARPPGRPDRDRGRRTGRRGRRGVRRSPRRRVQLAGADDVGCGPRYGDHRVGGGGRRGAGRGGRPGDWSRRGSASSRPADFGVVPVAL